MPKRAGDKQPYTQRPSTRLQVALADARGLRVRFDVIPNEPSLRLLATLGVIVRIVGEDGQVMEAAAHEILQTVDCKIGACPEQAEDRIGRYSGLCARHKQEAIEVWKAEGELRRQGKLASNAAVNADAVVQAAAAVHEQAKQVARLRRKGGEAALENAELGLKRAYVELGRAAGLLPPRSEQLRQVA